MYPNNYFSLFPPFPRNNNVFIAMSFDPIFIPRWENVIAPAIKRIELNGLALSPHRVDMRHISDSIMLEILDGIANDLLFLGDLTTIGYLKKKPIRNGNVMYEIGLAQSTRLPEEVILLRSDTDQLLFDVNNIRITSYDPDGDILGSQQQIFELIRESLTEIDLRRHLAIKKAAESLDYDCWLVLLLAVVEGAINNFPTKTMGQVLGNSSKNSAIRKLLEIGALETEFFMIDTSDIRKLLDGPADQIFKYKPTRFGREILSFFQKSIDITSLEISSTQSNE